MPYYSVADLVKKLRTQKGMSQEDLADGIMTTSNLSRFESGLQMPQKDKLDAILQRLGVDTQETYNYYLNKRDYEIYKKCDHLKSLIAHNKNSDASILLDELSEFPEFSENIKKQFLMSCKAAIMVNLGENNDKIRKLAIQALLLTVPTYYDKYISEYYLSDQEARLINILAITYYNENNLEKTIKLMDDLKTSIETMRIDEKHKSRIFTVILYNLSKYLGLAKKYKEAIKICDYSKKICIETSNYENLPGIIYNKAYVLYELGYKDVCERLIYIAYDMLEGMERYKERDIVKDYAKDRMGIVIEVKGKQDNGY